MDEGAKTDDTVRRLRSLIDFSPHLGRSVATFLDIDAAYAAVRSFKSC
jgi:hypothetical protein